MLMQTVSSLFPTDGAGRHALRLAFLRLYGLRPLDSGDDPRLTTMSSLTVDAFDTLVTRPVYQASDVFLMIGVILRNRRIISTTASEWKIARHSAENALAIAVAPREVLLDDIYKELVSRGVLSAADARQAQDIELGLEHKLSRPIAANIDLVNAFESRGGSVDVLSDTYLPHDDVCRLLSQAGLHLDHTSIHTSSQSLTTKRGGELFRHTLGKTRGVASQTLHVGDNLHSDVWQARAAGLAAAPYLTGRPNRYEMTLRRTLPQPALLGSIMAGSARSVRLGRVFPSLKQQAIWTTSASVVGPLLFAFVAWCLKEAVRRGLKTLYFLARDGEVLLKVAKTLLPTCAPHLTCRYLHVSRRSLHLPAVVEMGSIEREWILDCATERTFRSLLSRLDIEPVEFLKFLPATSPLQTKAPDALLSPADVTEMAYALDYQPVCDLILERAAQRRATCIDYMTQEGLLEPGNIGIVDIGWRGRLQRSLCRAVMTEDPGFAKRLHGFYIDLTSQPSDSGSFSTFSTESGDRSFSWAKRGPLFEIFCAAHHGTVLGYKTDLKGRSTPLLASQDNPVAESWGLLVQQDAVVAFSREAAETFNLAHINPLDHTTALAKAACDVTRLFVEQPDRAEGDAYGSFLHAEDEQHERFEEMAGMIDFNPVSLARRLTGHHPGRRISFWPEGSLARSIPFWLRGSALSMFKSMPGRDT